MHVGDPVYGYGWYTNNTSDIAGYITSITDNDHFSFFNVRTQSTVNLVYERLDASNRAITDYMYVLDTANQAFRLPLSVGDEMVPDYNSNNMFDIQHLPTYIRSDNHHYFIAPNNGYAIIQIDRENSAGYTPNYSVNGFAMQYGPFWVTNYINWNIPLRKGDVLRVWSDRAADEFAYGRKLFVKATNMAPLYFFVGETMQDANIINVGRIVEAGAQLTTLLHLSEELGPMRTRYVVETWNNGTDYYTVYNDGWCEQGGEVTVSTTTGEYAYNLHKPYVDTNYTVMGQFASYYSNDFSSNRAMYPYTTSQFKIRTASTIGGKQSWRAVGFIPMT